MTSASESTLLTDLTTPADMPDSQDEPDASTPKRVFVETLGCQMNVNDSELMLGLLKQRGFVPSAEPKDADLVVLNTCQIRETATDRAFGHVHNYNKLKKLRPSMKIAVTGCMAQQLQGDVFKRAPYVDIVVGTQNIKDLPDLVETAFEMGETSDAQVMAVDRQKDVNTYAFFDDVLPERQSKVTAWVSIIEGCDYFCTYCVVPYTRGRQISRDPASILKEVLELEAQGYKEITLLGQTVDSYGKDFTDRDYRLADLLFDIHEQAPGLQRLRFMTSHPLDLTDDIIEAIACLPRVMEYIHIPMQAGDNTVLERMRRGYTREQYFELIDKIRARVPNVAISGDFIVAFPGETREQFEQTLDAVDRLHFDTVNTAIYSPRRQTPAAIWTQRGEGEIPRETAKAHLEELMEALRVAALTNNQPLLGTEVELLLEGESRKKHLSRWMGRTRNNKVVNVDMDDAFGDLLGRFVMAEIYAVGPYAMQARVTRVLEAPLPVDKPGLPQRQIKQVAPQLAQVGADRA